MLKNQLIIIMLYIAFAAGACAPAQKASVAQSAVISMQDKNTLYRSSSVPKAQIYKTNGNYIDNVAITLSQDRKSIISYPAPSDVSVNSQPIALADGYLLDRRGVGKNSAFLKITYSEYSKLKSSPSPAQLMEMIIPDAAVTALVRLPMTTSEAVADTAQVNQIINDGLRGCKVIFAPLVLQSQKNE